VKVNEQVPVSSNPDWDWFINNAYQTSVADPSEGFSVSITSGETTTVSLNGRVGQCHLNAAIVLQGCSGPPGNGGSPSPTAAQSPPTTQTPTGTQTPTATPPVENQPGLDLCHVWMILNVILIILALILIPIAFCAPNSVTISLAVTIAAVAVLSLVFWLILCPNWILVDAHFCQLLRDFMTILAWIAAVVALLFVSALIAFLAGQAEAACAVFGLLSDLSFVGTILAICELLNTYLFHCP
jgi:hypothetical protein